MRVGCALAGIVAVSVPVHGVAHAAYPERPIRVIVPQPAGGNPDIVARLIGPGIARALGQQIVVDNRSGAGGLIGAELAARAAPDGYTLFLTGPSVVVLPHVMKQAAYDPVKDFAAVSLISMGPYLLLNHPSASEKSVKELIAYAKADPKRYTYASSGNGGPSHLAMEHFRSMAGIQLTHVPYKGVPQAITDLIGGAVNLTFISLPPVVQHVRAGRLRAIAVSGTQRAAQLPDVPTVMESGMPGFEWTTWNGLLAPARTPASVIARMSEAVAAVVKTPEISSQFSIQGAEPVGGSAADFAQFLRAEWEKYGKVVKLSGARVD